MTWEFLIGVLTGGSAWEMLRRAWAIGKSKEEKPKRQRKKREEIKEDTNADQTLPSEVE